MRKISLLLSFVFVLLYAQKNFAQEWQKNITDYTNFYNIHNAFLKEHDNKKPDPNEDEKDGYDEIYSRWAYLMEQRTYPTGKPYRPDIIYKEWDKYQATHKTKSLYKKNNWSYFGPNNSPTNYGGDGRTNCLTFDPKDPNTMWAGTPTGGLWKTTDGGKTWNTNTDNLPCLGVSDIVINPRNTDTMYIATGDGWGYPIGNGNFWGGTYSRGIMRSTNGGQSWENTGFNYDYVDAQQVTKLIMNPQNPHVLIAATNNGIWKSYDDGKNWKQIISTGMFYDLTYRPGDSMYVYASGKRLYTSTNGGENFNVVSSINTATAVAVAVTNNNADVVYAAVLNSGYVYIYKSTNKGNTFSQMGYTYSTTFYGWYTLAFNVSPVNEKVLILGGIAILKSLNSGQTFTAISNNNPGTWANYSHADNRTVEFYPGSGSHFFVMHDGGISESKDGGSSFKQISNDIHALQLYRLGTSSLNNNLLYTGAQDNGINRGRTSGWDKVIYADGMEAAICPADDRIVLASTQYGALKKSTDGGKNFTGIAPGSGNWVTPFVFGSQKPHRVYYGSSILYISENDGTNWSSKYPTLNGRIQSLAVAPSNDSVIYVSGQADQYTVNINVSRSTDLGDNWTSITSGLPTGTAYVSYLAVDRRDAKTVYATFSGFSDGNKVYKSTDGGDNWTNISGTLPNVPVNCVATEGNTNHGVYIGTDVGVFYINDGLTDWVYYNDGLPTGMVMELEVSLLQNKVWAATYGRGIWSADLQGNTSAIDLQRELDTKTYIYPNPATNGKISLKVPTDFALPQSIEVTDITGKIVYKEKYNSASTLTEVNLSSLSKGVYIVSVVYPKQRVSKRVVVQ